MAFGFNNDKSKHDIENHTLSFSVGAGFIESWKAPFNYSSARGYINGGTVNFLMKFDHGSDLPGKEGEMFTLCDPYKPGINYVVGLILSTAKPYLPIGTFWIGADGKLNYYMSSLPASGCYFTITYPCEA